VKSTPAHFSAEMLRVSTKGLVALATERLLPVLQDSQLYGKDPASTWRQHLAGRMADLALALDDDWPEQFRRQVGWARVAFLNRQAPLSDLKHSLSCLHQVIDTELPPEVAAPAVNLLEDTLTRFDGLGEHEAASLSTETPAAELGTRYVVTLLEGNRRQACELVLDAVRGGVVDVRDAITEVCLPAQRELGRMWHHDELTVSEEHFISSTTVRLLSQLLMLGTPRADNGKTVLASSLEGDEHDIGLRAVSDLFELDGWRTIFLGRGVPVVDIVWAVKAFDVDLVMLSATLPAHVRPVRQVISRLEFEAEGDAAVPVIVGGQVFFEEPGLGDEIGAAATPRTAREALAEGSRLVGLDG
jgi:methanogenic corrinoid protein MtbC1